MKLPLVHAAIALAVLCPLVSGQEIKLLPSDGTIHDRFGYSVAISGNTAVVGARYGDNNGSESGSAYLFDTTTGAEIAKLTASDGASDDQFGYSVAISGNMAIVGAYGDDDNASDSGSAYLFDTTTGAEIAKLTASGPDVNDHFGCSVSISGTTAIVGARYDDDNGHNSGSAYLFDTSTGALIAKLTASDGATDQYFGISVAIDGNTAIVGARFGDGNRGNSGSAYLFDTTTGAEIAKLAASDGRTNDYFGYSVAISGNTAIVGAFGDETNGSASGSAYLFDTTTGTQIERLTASDADTYDYFGISVAISGTTAIVGASEGDPSIPAPGSAYLFDITTGAEIAKLTASDGASYDEFGYSVAFSGAAAIVGAYGDDDNGDSSGSAYLYLFDCNNNGIEDSLEIANAPSLDCDSNGHIDECELAAGIGDCNLNGLFDACECVNGTVQDCNANLVPDLCEGLPDCDRDSLPDECEIDCNSNGTPDDCETGNDCNLNSIPDECDLATGASEDCNGNSIPDECDIANSVSIDCDGNGVPDDCDIAAGTPDCNGNDIPDSCDIAVGTETDLNTNGTPDSCECLVANYCSSSPNSAGPGVQISFHGISSVSLNNVILNAQGGPNHQPGLFFYGPGTTSQPFGDGIRCVTTPIFRLPPPVFFTGAADPSGPGNAGSQIDLTTGAPSSGPGQIQAGSTWYFQLWYRDPQGGPWGFNLSNGLEITFCP